MTSLPGRHRLAFTVARVLALSLLLSAIGHADEGFWPFNRLPKAAIKQAYGVDLTDAWVERVQQASVRFPSGSGSFVSADGLVLTNHHVALDIIQSVSTAERDYVKNGFVATERSQELRAPDLELLVLQNIRDVTGEVNAAITPGMASADTLSARRAAIATLEKEAQEKTGLQSEVVTLYQGGQYHLYQYKKFTDVRLVFAPEIDIAFFGGDPDNFTYPRYCLDMALFRVYENGKPVAVKHFLPWSTAGVKENDPVFTSGHPGATQRLNTMAHLEFLRDHALPANIDLYGRVREALAAYSAQGAEQERQAKDLLFSIENSLKSWRGQLAGLKDPSLMARKRASEQSLRSAIMAKPDLNARFGDAWDAVEKARRAVLPYNMQRVLLEGGLGFYSDAFAHARTLVRWAAESQRPNEQRLPEFTEARKAQIERQLASAAPIYPGMERARLAAGLSLLRDHFGADHVIVKQVLAGKTIDARTAELVEGTRLREPAFRKELFAGGPAAIQGSTDPFIEIARLIEPRARELRTRYDNELVGVERDAYAKIAQAVFALHGDAAYPDGTFTLRLSYGAVRGYMEDGRRVPPNTTYRGLYIRADEHGQKPPYQLPERWAKARGALNLETPYNFVSTNDIVGGNSGSPVINAKGELVGLIFDGNIQSLPAYFAFDSESARAVSVDVRGMIEALRKVYGAEVLVSELLASAAATAAK
jgi:hypothetical protein